MTRERRFLRWLRRQLVCDTALKSVAVSLFGKARVAEFLRRLWNRLYGL